MKQDEDKSHNICVSDVELRRDFIRVWRIVSRYGGSRGRSLARSRLSLELPQECTAGRLSHSQLKLPRLAHRCKSPGLFAEIHAVTATARRPKWGPPILPFGRENFHSNGRLRKQHLGPVWCHKATNSELINQRITGRADLLAAAADSVPRGGTKRCSLFNFSHIL